MKTFWLTGEKFDESKTDSSRSKKITIDEGIDEVEEITFTFHVSDHDSELCHTL